MIIFTCVIMFAQGVFVQDMYAHILDFSYILLLVGVGFPEFEGLF